MLRGNNLVSEHRPASAAGSRRGGLCCLVGQTATSLGAGGVVVVPVVGLHEVHELVSVQTLEGAVEEAEVADNGGSDEDDHEQDEEGEVENGVTDDATLAELRLLEGVDGGADLATVKIVSTKLFEKMGNRTYLGRSQKSMTEWNLSM